MAYKLRLYMCIFFSGVFKFKQNNLRSFTNIYIYIHGHVGGFQFRIAC
jgi:hypothetical protein